MKLLFQPFVRVLLLCTFTIPANAQTDAIKIIANGNVGIGTENPTEKLQVEGNLKVNGRVMDKTGLLMPAGAIVPFAGSVAPPGWLLCNGASYSKTGDQKDLFAVIGVMYGTDGNDTFKVPDMQGSFVMGALPNKPADSLGKSGNADVHNHSVNPPAATFNTTTAGKHTHKFPGNWYKRNLDNGGYSGIDTGGSDVKNQTTQEAGDHAHQVNVELPGFTSGASSGKNRPKWIALNYIIKY
jgi:microcystin-dependent protein